LKHAIQLKQLIHAIFLNLFVLILELLTAATSDDTSTKQVQIRADLIIIAPIDKVLRVLITKDEKLILNIKL